MTMNRHLIFFFEIKTWGKNPQCFINNLTKHSVVVKIWPHSRWRHVSLTFQLSEVDQSSPLKSMLFPTSTRSAPRFPPFRRLSFRTKQLQQQFTLDLRWQLRQLIFIHVHNVWRHSARAVMNCDEFSCMQSLQASTIDRDRYDKSTYANHAVTNISPAPSVTMPTAQSRISKPCPPTKKGIRSRVR